MHHELQIDHSTEHEPLATVPEALAPSVLSEDLALSQLNNREITADAIEKITQNAGTMKSRKVRMALASHPRTPRRIALRVIRELYTFELMQLALLPGTAGDVRRFADELLAFAPVVDHPGRTHFTRAPFLRTDCGCAPARQRDSRLASGTRKSQAHGKRNCERIAAFHCRASICGIGEPSREMVPSALRSAWRCCEMHTLRSRVQSTSRAGSHQPNSETSSTPRACQKESSNT